MKYDKKFVAQAIRNYRLRNSYTQEELALKIGTSPNQIMRWETAKTLPNKMSSRVLVDLKILPPRTS